MSRDWESEFVAMKEFYPGSNKQIIRHKPAPVAEVDEDSWDAKPKRYTLNGVEVEFFSVGQLAQALGRKSVTVRKWERDGVIPKAQFTAPSHDPRGKRRLYTRSQVEGIVRIAHEEGVLEAFQTPFAQTKFTERVIELFQNLGVPGQ